MKARRLALMAILAAGVCPVRGFEILPLVDESDWAGLYDIERTNGMVQVLEQMMRTHPTTILWRDKGAGRYWLPLPGERTQYGDQPLDKRLVPCYGSFGYLRLDRDEFTTLPKMRRECDRRGVGYGFHTGFEDNHQIPTSEANWNMAHPEFSCLNHAQMPRLACASLAFPEVLEHKLRLVDERLALKPEIIFLDMHRAGGWSVDIEYVKPVCDRWRAKYRCEPPENPRDPRWIEHCSEDVMRYLRQFSARCRAKGTRFLFGIQKVQTDYDYMWDRYGIDWKTLAKEGVFDGLVVMGVKPDTSRPFESTREILSYVKANCGGTPMYWQASSYHSNNGFPDYAKWAKTDTVTAMKRMLELAKEVGCAGAILECVDPGHYSDEHCKLLADARTPQPPNVKISIKSYETRPAERPADTNEVAVTPPKGMKIFLLMGQSNMAGRGRVPQEWKKPLARALKMNRDGNWVEATSPLHFDRKTAGVGPGDMFIRRYLEDHPGETVGVVPCAVGGSGIPTWTPTDGDGQEGANFRNAVARARKAKASGEIVAMLWHQGETDAKRYGGKLSQAEFEDYYVARFSRMVETLRKELDIPDLPVFVGEVGAFLPDLQKNLNPALATAVRGLPHCALVPSADLNTCMPDHIHFDTAAQKTLGARYYDAFKRLSGRQGK